MPESTTYSAIPYPIATDAPYVHLDLKNMAQTVDEALPVIRVAAPPHRAGRLWFDGTDLWQSDGTAWSWAGGKTFTANLVYNSSFTPDTIGPPLVIRKIGSRYVEIAGGFKNLLGLAGWSAYQNLVIGQLDAPSVTALAMPASRRYTVPAAINVTAQNFTVGAVHLDTVGTVSFQTVAAATAFAVGAASVQASGRVPLILP